MSTQSLDDLALVSAFKQTKDQQYLAVLYNRYHLFVFGLCYKMTQDTNDAKDLTSEIFMHVMEKLPDATISFFKSWLYSVSKNYIYSELRKKNKIVESLEEKNWEEFMEFDEELRLNIKEQNVTLLEQALSNLKPEQRACIERFYLQDQSYNEVALHTGYDINKVKSYIQNGKRNLKIYFEQNQNHDE
ncbi:MAG: RNA polymerase sigma factor [Chitinophagales bacterium]|nr:RNA polymerase sigma factor [Chitinophagales bacterium]